MPMQSDSQKRILDRRHEECRALVVDLRFEIKQYRELIRNRDLRIESYVSDLHRVEDFAESLGMEDAHIMPMICVLDWLKRNASPKDAPK
jgi:hypothetical protein